MRRRRITRRRHQAVGLTAAALLVVAPVFCCCFGGLHRAPASPVAKSVTASVSVAAPAGCCAHGPSAGRGVRAPTRSPAPTASPDASGAAGAIGARDCACGRAPGTLIALPDRVIVAPSPVLLGGAAAAAPIVRAGFSVALSTYPPVGPAPPRRDVDRSTIQLLL